VWLEGQACFDIVKDPGHPFLVHVGTTTVKVLGTRFNWMHYPGVASEITLLDGKVRFDCGDVERDLVPGEQAVIREAQGQEGPIPKITVQKPEDPKKSIAWLNANPTIEFTNVDLYTVVQRLAHYYKVGVKWSPEVRGDLVIASLSLRNSLSQNIDVIAYAVKGFARVEAKDGLIQVTN
jgi:ferric-dicitrate binding protein FerR (iron transport regulator)